MTALQFVRQLSMVSPVRTAGIVQEAWRICLENLICASSRVSILQRVSPQHALFDLPMAVPTRLILRPRGCSVFVDGDKRRVGYRSWNRVVDRLIGGFGDFRLFELGRSLNKVSL